MESKLAEALEEFSKAYYSGNATISDAEYDALSDMHSSISPLGAKEGTVSHMARMYSLGKVTEGDSELPSWAMEGDAVDTIKLDGAALSLTYVKGDLVSVVTRGDGFKGKDVTEVCKQLDSIPNQISDKYVLLQVRGEAVADKAENSRNVSSGIVNTKDPAAFLAKALESNLEFVAYDVVVPTNTDVEDFRPLTGSYLRDMEELSDLGFMDVVSSDVSNKPTDGTVYRVNSNMKYFDAGFTAKFPRAAIAYKEKQDYVVTKLLDVTWQVGASGKVTPVAIFEEILLEDAKTTRATLNNIAYIELMDLEIGDNIKVIRAGGIIPKIIGKED